jgi:hypothetical protein
MKLIALQKGVKSVLLETLHYFIDTKKQRLRWYKDLTVLNRLVNLVVTAPSSAKLPRLLAVECRFTKNFLLEAGLLIEPIEVSQSLICRCKDDIDVAKLPRQ